MTALVDAVRDSQQQATSKAMAAYWAIVRRSAANEAVEPLDIVQSMEGAGLDIERFESDVSHVQHRMALRRTLDAAGPAGKEAARLEREVNSLRAEIERVRRDQATKLTQLIAQLQAARVRAGQGTVAEHDLRNSVRDPQLLAQERTLSEERHRLSEDLRDAMEFAAASQRDVTHAEHDLVASQRSAKLSDHASVREQLKQAAFLVTKTSFAPQTDAPGLRLTSAERVGWPWGRAGGGGPSHAGCRVLVVLLEILPARE